MMLFCAKIAIGSYNMCLYRIVSNDCCFSGLNVLTILKMEPESRSASAISKVADAKPEPESSGIVPVLGQANYDPETAVESAKMKEVRIQGEPQAYIDSYDEMYPNWQQNEEPIQVLDIPLVMKRTLLANSKAKEEKMTAEEKADWLTQGMSHLRLDRENIAVIENLECFSAKLTHLYLQHNRIEVISGLTCLEKLKFLCLSHNKIKVLDTEELPKDILVIYMDGNPCADNSDYPMNLISALPKLKSVDFQSVTEAQKRRARAFLDPNLQEPGDDSENSSSENEESSGDESGPEDISSILVKGFDKLDPAKQQMLNELDIDIAQVENIEELLTTDQLQIWRTSYEQVKILSSSEEGETSSGEENAQPNPENQPSSSSEPIANTEIKVVKKGGKKKRKTKKKSDGLKIKTEKEKKNLKKLGINPAHFRDLTVKLLGRSRARQLEDVQKHNKKQSKLDTFREQESERLSNRKLPVSDRVVYDRTNKVTVEVLSERGGQSH